MAAAARALHAAVVAAALLRLCLGGTPERFLGPRGCCEHCQGRDFCSPVSSNCYETKRKQYYVNCTEMATSAPTMAPTVPTLSPSPAPTLSCCEVCDGFPFCSPQSHTCYPAKWKAYYETCGPTPAPTAPTPVPTQSPTRPCCEVCGGFPFCSQVTGNCHNVKMEEHIETCGPPEGLTVLTYNVLYTNFYSSWGLHQVADNILSNVQPDVMGNQECMDLYQMQDALGTELVAAPDTDAFNCIFYRPSSSIEYGGVSGHQYLGDDARDHHSMRYFTWVKLLHNGTEFWVFNTHWCIHGVCTGVEGGLRHQRSAQRMLEKRLELGAGDAPTIILGDLNSHAADPSMDNDPGVRHFLGNGFDLAGKSTLWGGIDYVFVSKGHWRVGGRHIGDFGGSDHKPISMRLTLNVTDV